MYKRALLVDCHEMLTSRLFFLYFSPAVCLCAASSAVPARILHDNKVAHVYNFRRNRFLGASGTSRAAVSFSPSQRRVRRFSKFCAPCDGAGGCSVSLGRSSCGICVPVSTHTPWPLRGLCICAIFPSCSHSCHYTRSCHLRHVLRLLLALFVNYYMRSLDYPHPPTIQYQDM